MLDDFNALPPDRAEEALLAVCAAPAWTRAVVAGRPYASAGDALARGEAAFAALTWDDIAQALAAHPRIGQRPTGESREAAWSRREQSDVSGAESELKEANRAYEERFGHIFLIFASGKTAPEILAAARQRLTNDDATERGVVRDELGKIVQLRLERLLQP